MPGPLENQQHEAFCNFVAKLDSDMLAYKKAFNCTQACAEKNAWRLRDIEGVKKRIIELQSKTASRTTMTVKERRQIAAEIARNKSNEPGVRLTATVIEAKHAGEFMERQDLTTDGEALPAAMPAITLNLPATFLKRRGMTPTPQGSN